MNRLFRKCGVSTSHSPLGLPGLLKEEFSFVYPPLLRLVPCRLVPRQLTAFSTTYDVDTSFLSSSSIHVSGDVSQIFPAVMRNLGLVTPSTRALSCHIRIQSTLSYSISHFSLIHSSNILHKCHISIMQASYFQCFFLLYLLNELFLMFDICNVHHPLVTDFSCGPHNYWHLVPFLTNKLRGP
jgi:hypothetical protein